MPLPPIDNITNVLPPFMGEEPGHGAHLMSPYKAEFRDLVTQFGTTPDRHRILQGFRSFREELRSLKILGFQWVCGSFVENCETTRGRSPDDVDVVTFVDKRTELLDIDRLFSKGGLHGDRAKATYHVHSFIIPHNEPFGDFVKLVTFWNGLFSHRRDDFRWKGFVSIPLEFGQTDQLPGDPS